MSKEIDKIELKWTYSPKNYLRDEMIIREKGAEIKISEGTAVAIIDPENNNSIDNLKIELTESINNRFDAIQILNHKQFSLSKPSRTDYYKGGDRHIYLRPDSISYKTTIGTVDIVHKDKDGNVIFDSKKERREKQKWFAEAINKFRQSDKLLDQMLKSYQQAVEDPEDELIHLFEIIEALIAKFGNTSRVRGELKFDKKMWKPLRELANDPEIKQGRHRGKSGGELRKARDSELNKARDSARMLIEKYLEYLERGNSN